MGIRDFLKAIKETANEVSATIGAPVYVLNCEICQSEGLHSAYGNYQMKINFGISSASLPDAIEFEYMYVDMNGNIILEETYSCSSRNFKATGNNLYVTVPMKNEPSLMASSIGQAWPYRVFQNNGAFWSNNNYLEDEKRCREKIEMFLREV